MKVLCIIDSLGSGGAQRQLVAIAKGIKANGNDVSFLVYHDESFYLQELVDNNIAYYCLDGDGYLKRILRIRKFIRNGEYDGVISFLEGANFITTLAGFPFRKWKLIVGERNANPNILNSYKLRFYRFFHFFTDFIVSNSQTNIDMVRKINPLLKKRKLKVIYNSVDFGYWKHNECREIFRDGKCNIVIAASHEDRKNAVGMIEALNSLDENYLNSLNIDWYGRFDKAYQESVELVNKYGLGNVVTFYPATSNIKEKMESADFIGLFSLYEGLPNVICEALSLGKPVITSAVSDLPIILKNTNNILFDPTDSSSIKKAFEDLFTLNKEEIRSIGNENIQLAREYFDVQKSINLYLQLL